MKRSKSRARRRHPSLNPPQPQPSASTPTAPPRLLLLAGPNGAILFVNGEPAVLHPNSAKMLDAAQLLNIPTRDLRDVDASTLALLTATTPAPK